MKNHLIGRSLFASLSKGFILSTIFLIYSLEVNAQWQNGTNIYNNNTGNVGIGTSTPSYKLDVAGSWAFRQDGYFYNSIAHIYESSTNQYFHFKISQSKGHLGMNSTNSIVLQANGGFVGIGTLNPEHKLDVKGTVRAMEVKVDVNVPADYVFDENYSLKSLAEVESFVKANHHLPGIPSAKEIQASGWELGVMSNKLLEKIEELTLYVIELKKENEEMKLEISEMKNCLSKDLK